MEKKIVLMPMEQQIWFLKCDALDVACCVILEVTLLTFATSVIDQTGHVINQTGHVTTLIEVITRQV